MTQPKTADGFIREFFSIGDTPEEEKEMDGMIHRLEMNMSNNYKDNAQDNLRELEKTLKDMRSAGNIRTKVIEKYELILDDYKEKMKDFRHKDQKPYWH